MDTPDPDPRDEVPEASPEEELRAAIAHARATGNAVQLALGHARLAAWLSSQGDHDRAVVEADTAIGYVDLLAADGHHEIDRLLRITTPAAPLPNTDDIPIHLLQGETRTLLAECLAAAGRHEEASRAVDKARPFAKGLRRRGMRKRLDAVAAVVASAQVGDPGLAELSTHLRNEQDPTRRRALRLRLAGRLLDDGRAEDALRESLLLVRDADEAQDTIHRAGARQVMGLALEAAGRPAEAVLALREAFDDLLRNGQNQAGADMAEALAQRVAAVESPAEAIGILRRGVSAAESAGDTAAAMRIRTGLGGMLDAAGEPEAARLVFTEVADDAESAGDPLTRADAQHGLAVVLATRFNRSDDDVVEALSLLDSCRDTYRDNGLALLAAGCDHEAGALLGRRGALQAAAARYRSARDTYHATPQELRDDAWHVEEADTVRNLDLLHRLESDPDTLVPTDAFASGGHTMEHSRSIAPGPGQG